MTAELPIPLEALEDCGLVLGRRGAGKSGCRTLFLEHELDRGRRCCLIDPKGDSWGIRLNPDGSRSRFQEVAIFGGLHPDYELTEEMGETLGQLVATHNLSCIIDMSALSIAGMRRFARDFAEALFDHNTQPLTLFVDEADQLAPQPLPKDMTMLLHRMDRLIRQGRHRGIFLWMFTQRPQVLHPNLRSQAESLITMRLTTPLDIKAATEWLEVHDPEQAKAVLPALPKLHTGEAIVSVPAADFLEQVQFPLFSTFDSMRTPRHGEVVAQVSLPPIDTSEIAAALGAVAIQARTEKALGAYAAGTEVGDLLVEKDARIRALEDDVAALTDEVARLSERVQERQAALIAVRRNLDGHIRCFEEPALDLQPADANSHAIAGSAAEVPSSPPHNPRAGEGEARPKVTRAAASPISATDDAAAAPEREYRALAVLAAAAPLGLSEAAWAARAGYKRKGGAWLRRKARYARAGLITFEDGKYHATLAGLSQVGEEIPDFPPPGPELIAFWARRLGAPGKILQILARLYPQTLTRGAIAVEANMSAKGGAFTRHISALKSAELVIERGKRIGVAPAVMGEAP